jgi:hypothetical protein
MTLSHALLADWTAATALQFVHCYYISPWTLNGRWGSKTTATGEYGIKASRSVFLRVQCHAWRSETQHETKFTTLHTGQYLHMKSLALSWNQKEKCTLVGKSDVLTCTTGSLWMCFRHSIPPPETTASCTCETWMGPSLVSALVAKRLSLPALL